LRGQARITYLAVALHGRVAVVRSRDLHHRADLLPGAAGLWRWHDHAARADHHWRYRRTQAHGPRDGTCRGADDARSDARTAGWRRAHPVAELALDLL